MKTHTMTASCIVALAMLVLAPVGSAAQERTPTSLRTVRVTHDVLADGQALGKGVYEVRLTGEADPPVAIGMSPRAERWVEFLSKGVVVGREVATVVSNADMAGIAESPRPATNSSRTDVLRGGDYLRTWINRDGTHYLINMPIASAPRMQRAALATPLMLHSIGTPGLGTSVELAAPR